MEKILILLICFTSFNFQGGHIQSESLSSFDKAIGLSQVEVEEQDTCKYLKEQAEWYYTPWTLSYQTIEKVEIIGDTLIENRLCSIMGVTVKDTLVTGSELVIFYDENLAHVYFYEDETFKIIYDYSSDVMIGDTISYYLPQNFDYYNITSSHGSYTLSKNAYAYRVIDLPYLDLPDGSQLRTIKIRTIEEEFPGTILQGMGFSNGFLGTIGSQLTGGSGGYFRCYQSNSFNYSEKDCLLSSTNEIPASAIKIYPNPVSQVLSIETDGAIEKIKLMDISGRIVLEMEFKESVDVSKLNSGIYIIHLIDKEGYFLTKKIVIE